MTSEATGAAIRVLLAIGDRTLERRLAHELPEHGLVVAGRALDAPMLTEAVSDPGIDVVLVSADLHRLGEASLLALRDRRIAVVVLAVDAVDVGRFGALARVIPARSSGATIAAAIVEAESRGPVPADVLNDAAGPLTVPGTAPETNERGMGEVIAVASGKGAPGRTTVAIALAAELGRSGLDVVLVDTDLRGGNVAPYLDLDPRRGLVGVSASSGSLAERLQAELQAGPGCAVLAGVERPELANTVRPETLGAVLATLRARFERVVVDLGVPAVPSVLHAADDVIVVTGADLVSVWNARASLPGIREAAPAARVRLLVNRHEGREHYDAVEMERALGIDVLGVVREDRKAARRAISAQIPLSATGGGAATDLRAIATLLRDGNEQLTRGAAMARGVAAQLVMER